MKDVRLLTMMGGALILAWLLAPTPARSLPAASATPRGRQGRPEATPSLRPIEVDESFTPRRLLH